MRVPGNGGRGVAAASAVAVQCAGRAACSATGAVKRQPAKCGHCRCVRLGRLTALLPRRTPRLNTVPWAATRWARGSAASGRVPVLLTHCYPSRECACRTSHRRHAA